MFQNLKLNYRWFEKMEDTSNTLLEAQKINENPELAKTPAEAAGDVLPKEEKSEQVVDLPNPEKGFGPTGQFFTVKIDTRYGYLAILGWLDEAKDFLKFHIMRQRQMQAEMESKKK